MKRKKNGKKYGFIINAPNVSFPTNTIGIEYASEDEPYVLYDGGSKVSRNTSEPWALELDASLWFKEYGKPVFFQEITMTGDMDIRA